MDGIKTRKHAPYRKSYLIPIWVIQLGFSCFNVFMAGISTPVNHNNNNNNNQFNPNTTTQTAFNVLHLILNIVLIISILCIVVKFANFSLTTKFFKIQSIAAVVIGAICIILYCTQGGGDFILAIFPGVAWLASIAICVRVCLLRRRVKRGEIGEMRRAIPGREEEVVDARVNVELQERNKFRIVEEVGKGGSSVNVMVGVGSENTKPRSSFNSDGMGILSAPEKVAREFV